MILSLLWFFITMFGLGFAVTREKNLMTLGAGLCVFSILAAAMNLAGIPLAWWAFLALALAYPAYLLFKGERNVLELPKFEFKKEIFLTLAVLIALMHLAIYYDGAFKYPYLEDDDPWDHAAAVQYIAQSQTASRPFDPQHFVRYYIEPYPPSYGILMAMALQLNDSVIPVLKTINIILISLALIFAFYFVSALSKSQEIGLYATFILAALPSFMSHFIWSQTLAMAIAFVALYALAKMAAPASDGTAHAKHAGLFALEEKKYGYLFAVACGALIISQPSVAAIMGVLIGIYALARIFEHRALLQPVFAFGAAGLLLTAALYWAPTYLKYGETTLAGIGIAKGFSDPTFTDKTYDTSSGLVYSLEDFLNPPSVSKMDQATGIGLVVVALVLLGALFYLSKITQFIKPGHIWLTVVAIWLVFAFLGTQGNAMPIKLFPHRFWVFLSIPVAILAAYGMHELLARFQTREFRYGILAALVIGIFLTSAQAKIAVQTSAWPPGVEFGSSPEVSAYVTEMAALPKGTKIFGMCSPDDKVMAFDMRAEPFNLEYAAFKRGAWKKTWEQVYSFLKMRGYEYMTLDTYCLVLHPAQEVNERSNSVPVDLFELYKVSPDPQQPALLLFKVK